MQTTPTVSTNKIIVILVFICAAIMTSLFLFHLQNQPVNNVKSDDMLLFPAPRDLQTFKLVTADNKPFTVTNLRGHWTLLFFGFTHCASVCPTTLAMMGKAYEKLHPNYRNLQVVLVSLDPDRDTPAALKRYTSNYNKDFIGVTGKINELRKFQSQFGVFSEVDAASGNNYQIRHTPSILLVNPEGKYAGLFKYGLSPEQFATLFSANVKG